MPAWLRIRVAAEVDGAEEGEPGDGVEIPGAVRPRSSARVPSLFSGSMRAYSFSMASEVYPSVARSVTRVTCEWYTGSATEAPFAGRAGASNARVGGLESSPGERQTRTSPSRLHLSCEAERPRAR